MYVSSVRTKVRECALLATCVTSVRACTKDDRSLCFDFILYEPTLKNGSFFNQTCRKPASSVFSLVCSARVLTVHWLVWKNTHEHARIFTPKKVER